MDSKTNHKISIKSNKNIENLTFFSLISRIAKKKSLTMIGDFKI